MIIAQYFVLACCAIVYALAVTDFICSEIAYRQRKRVIDMEYMAALSNRRDMRSVNEVMTYRQHVTAILLFRDPMKKYRAWLAQGRYDALDWQEE
jgi:hypothetical protein